MERRSTLRGRWFGGALVVAAVLGALAFGVLRHTSPHTAVASVATKTVTCTGAPAHRYQVKFGDTSVAPASITVHLCDQVTIVNNSGQEVIVAIGPHTHHIHYPGFEETALSHGQSYAFRLTQTGSLFLHDHDNEALNSTINVQQ